MYPTSASIFCSSICPVIPPTILCEIHGLYAMISDGPSCSSASFIALIVCCILAPIDIEATYTLGIAIAILNKSFLPSSLPLDANSATLPTLVDLDFWPPVFEYTSVSRTIILIFSFEWSTWSSPP